MKPLVWASLWALLLAATPAVAGTATVAAFGTGADGVRVDAITLKNRRGTIVTIITRGAAVTQIMAPDRSGRRDNVVLTRPDFEAWNRGGTNNTVIGRFANRIGNGFSIDGTAYRLPANPDGVTTHGGPGGWGTRVWSAAPFDGPDTSGVVMTLASPDGDNGFPGAVTAEVRYTLTDTDVLRLDFSARTDKPTHINLTNHLYFVLQGQGAGSIDNQRLHLMAARYTPTDRRQIPTGEIAAVAGTPFDFRTPRRIGPALRSSHPQVLIGRGIDHNFVIDGPAGTLRPAVRLHDPDTGRVLEVRTTEPGLQIYTGNGFNGAQPAGDGLMLRQGDAIALETQHFPDTPNRPEFPSTLLRPGEVLRSTTEFAFSTDAGGVR